MNTQTDTPLTLARKGAEALVERGIDNARLEAELLLAHVLRIKRLDLYLQHDRPLSDDEIGLYREVVRRRRRREPVQYIIGQVPFRELTLRVDRRALIPRPETEVLVGEVLRWAWARCGVQPPRPGRRRASAADGAGAEAEEIRVLRALDVGAGSGAIALSLLAEGPFEQVVATDVSADALSLTAENAATTGLAGRLELRQGASWVPVGDDEAFDAIVSNPPYVAEHERSALAPEVVEWEPGTALFSGADGLDVIRGLVAEAATHLRAGGLLALEVGAGQAGDVEEMLRAAGEYQEVRTVADLARVPRVVLATRRVID